MSNFQTWGQISEGLAGTAPTLFQASTSDSLATILATGYMNDKAKEIKLNDKIYINYSDTSVFPLYTGQAASYSEFLVTFDGTSNWSLVSNTSLVTKTLMTAAQWDGMYAAPFLLVPAPGTGILTLVDSVSIALTYGSTPFAAGGVVGAQYGNTVHGAGPAASTTEAAADFFVTASTVFRLGASVGTGAPVSTTANQGIYLSNLTGAFTGGTGTTLLVTTSYKLIAA